MPSDDERPPIDPERFSEWLARNLPPDRLTKIAAAVARTARRRNRTLDIRFLQLETWSEARGGDSEPDRLAKAVAAELILYLSRRPVLLDSLTRRTGAEGESLLIMKFIGHWRDRGRTLAADPRKYLYKAARTAISESESPQFHMDTKIRGVTRFSRSPDAPLAAPLTADDLADIPYPASEPMDGVESRRSAVLVRLADHFLTTAAALFGADDLRVRVADFVSWLHLHVRSPDPGKNAKSGEDGWENHCPAADRSVSPEQLLEWADAFRSELSPAERRLLRLRFRELLGYEEIAERLGRKSGGTAWNHCKKLEQRIRAFWNDRPIRDDRSARSLFFELLLTRLEDSELEKPKPEP